MFGKKYKNEFLKMFEEVNSFSNEDETDKPKLIKDMVKLFIKSFRHQSFQYQLVWSVRILCWLLIFAIFIMGIVIRIKNIF